MHQLDQIAIGTICKLVAFQDTRLAGKLLAMGVLPGSELQVVQKLWFGSSLFIEINNQRIALRKEEASTILVSKATRYKQDEHKKNSTDRESELRENFHF